MKAWTIQQLQDAMMQDLQACTTETERSCCKAVGGKEIREKAAAWAKERKLTPGELAIASKYGYKG